MTGYTQVYGSNEVAEPIIDIIMSVASFFVGVASLIAILLIYTWVKKHGNIKI